MRRHTALLIVAGILGAGASMADFEVTVNCTKGESLQSAIDSAPAGEPLSVEVIGFCPETVDIEQSWSFLRGVGTGSGATLLRLTGADYVIVENLSFSRLFLRHSSRAAITDVKVDDTVVIEDSSVRLDTVEIAGSGGVALDVERASVNIVDSSFEAVGTAIISSRSSILVQDSYVEGFWAYSGYERSHMNVMNSAMSGIVKLYSSFFSMMSGQPTIFDGSLVAVDGSFVEMLRVLQVTGANQIRASSVRILEGSSFRSIDLRGFSEIEVSNAEVSELDCRGPAEAYCTDSSIALSTCGGCPASP